MNKSPPIQRLNPKESEIMKQLRFYLDRRFGARGWVHIPNEFALSLSGSKMKSKHAYMSSLIAQGVKPGFPDVLIFEQPIRGFEAHGCLHIQSKYGMAIEVKREKGGKLSPMQKEYLKYFDSIGWATAIGYGYQDAINKIEEVYGR